MLDPMHLNLVVRQVQSKVGLTNIPDLRYLNLTVSQV